MQNERYPRRPPQPAATQNTLRIAVSALIAAPPRTDNIQRRLCDAVRRYGVKVPITVSPREDGRFTVLDGNRRVNAAIACGITTLVCTLADPDEQKPRLTGDMFAQAEQLEALIAARGWTQLEAAEQLGLSQSAVGNKLRLLRLHQNERDAILDAALSERHARAIVALPAERRSALIDEVIARRLTVAETEARIDSLRRPARTLPCRNGVRSRCSIRDIGIFYNSIDRALAILHEAGVRAAIHREEGEDEVRVIIHVSRGTSGEENGGSHVSRETATAECFT